MNSQYFFVIVLAAIGLFPLNATADDCKDFFEGSSAWAGCNSYIELEREDKQLNLTYRKLIAAMNKPDWSKTRKMLIEAQRAWVTYKEKECQLVQEFSGGVNKAPGLDCETDMTKERTAYLERILEDFK